jgi:HPt (histidine-containing phosphotransfer) domain-containing protein
LHREGDFDHFHSVLHRLSGAVGLVGARSLMEALRRASTSPLEHNTASIDALTARARTLVTQLEATLCAYRSTSQ